MKKFVWVALVVSLGANLLAAVIWLRTKPDAPLGQNQNFSERYPFLALRLASQQQNDYLVNFLDLRDKLNRYKEKSKVDYGLYFEYLPSGVSIGINERESFVLASLLKVPLAMGAMKNVEQGTMSLEEELEIKENNLDPLFGSLWKSGIGFKVTVNEAIRLMLVDSDNTAKSLLFNRLPVGTIESVFDYLDIPKEFGSVPVVSPKNYSSILRSLYLSSYLEVDKSNEILDLLTKSKFDDKLVAGVRQGVKVAHKIGVYEPGGVPPVHTDCGIVYVPKRPYILCVMARSDEESARKVMVDTSKMVYEYVEKANNPQN